MYRLIKLQTPFSFQIQCLFYSPNKKPAIKQASQQASNSASQQFSYKSSKPESRKPEGQKAERQKAERQKARKLIMTAAMSSLIRGVGKTTMRSGGFDYWGAQSSNKISLGNFSGIFRDV
ncbi:hypothetical protein PHYBLDRAFT_182991 [Phycomyces blakesleeanus NRRL 1555(-)]|uniref:Uncharacterized protein n=1 Tax=Phycomyces blakesleeanus (strain ATCC 8743b / DSM 1359 / FGSC 10004 / NBRC 33097 / NRRL 1555) TaxID=763407 RepID=A0A162WLM6_PHYB8|nr:hypothetical protein PHYBLDRAFT_182991 [Phycomyces blakesleeanus NRRL 1555(-)]OAD68885.1 hypothetical protein PHYBLDRAFT_182991 [Phycomyces blakesleeanus NRRL 1555(-)]|eukprot:XP_018286925.1 hypothetical protein PHYBLDRAFT_182991 [Phycomyces blakesleeanus NRRL 1555(-)]